MTEAYVGTVDSDWVRLVARPAVENGGFMSAEEPTACSKTLKVADRSCKPKLIPRERAAIRFYFTPQYPHVLKTDEKVCGGTVSSEVQIVELVPELDVVFGDGDQPSEHVLLLPLGVPRPGDRRAQQVVGVLAVAWATQNGMHAKVETKLLCDMFVAARRCVLHALKRVPSPVGRAALLASLAELDRSVSLYRQTYPTVRPHLDRSTIDSII